MKTFTCLKPALEAFSFTEDAHVKPFGTGHINDTFAVRPAGDENAPIEYVLQRINTHVFRQPKQLMENAIGITQHIHTQLVDEEKDAERGVQDFLLTDSGQSLYFDEEGLPWRCYHFIPGSYVYEETPTPEVFKESGRAFGEFLRMVSDYPADTLYDTIPDFHNTPARLDALKAAVREDKHGRLKDCRAEVDFALSRAEDCGMLTSMLEKGELPLRVTHNDTKLNNVLFDENDGTALCVIDLDTIMPGIVGNDFGDAIRFGASTAAEDEPDLDKVQLSLPMFEAFTSGYLEAAGDALTPEEKRTLPQSARLMTLECGMRFLTDHLLGDEYFRIHRPGHNLDRCRTQFKLVAEIEEKMDEMNEIVARFG